MQKKDVESFMCKKENFHNFEVHIFEDKYIFFSNIFIDSEDFYSNLFDYFFDESRLLRYAENKSNISFSPNIRNYASLYKLLDKFLDQKNKLMHEEEFENEILKILKDEYTLEEKGNGKIAIRLDKIGKIGEYIFSNILSDYFKFDCIIPKLNLITDPNMSVYGIDALFYSSVKDLIMFGESKVCNSLENGIALIKKSLEEYEQQIKDEYLLILSNRLWKDKFSTFGDKYIDAIEETLSAEEFIEKASVKKIGIPIFIAHGSELENKRIFERIHSIPKRALLGLSTEYYFISLPIINKSKLVATFTGKIKERSVFYEREKEKLQTTRS